MTTDFGFDIDFDDSAVRLIRRYVREVVAGLGLRGDSSFVEMEPRPGAYVALDGRMPGYPDHYLALQWTEQRGWTVAVEDRLGQLVEVARMDDADPRPAPADVVQWVRGFLHGGKSEPNRDFAAVLPVQRAS
ncbi:DUF6292 family protein [Lentzea sp. NPDC003310]|uniref:DUF6292 family protein n=1 Tax=Lentzea sp. NPDC003310 TaxID=3154447 RepID=UPI0033A41950